MFTPNLWDTVLNSQMRKLRFWEVEELVQSHLDNQISTVLFQRLRFTSYSILFIISGRVVPKTVFYQPRSIPSQHSSFWEASFSFLGRLSRLPGSWQILPSSAALSPRFSVSHTQNPHKANLCIQNPCFSPAFRRGMHLTLHLISATVFPKSSPEEEKWTNSPLITQLPKGNWAHLENTKLLKIFISEKADIFKKLNHLYFSICHKSFLKTIS